MTSQIPSAPSPSRFDVRIVLEVPLRQFVPWLAAVILVTWSGYPGVVCVTPLAWLIALRVGIVCERQSKSDQARLRLQEAALAGGWFGLLQGLLFMIIVPRMGPLQTSEQVSATAIIVLMIVMGILAGAGLSVFSAYNIERRQQANP